MLLSIRKCIYDVYDSGYRRANILFALHRKIIKSTSLARAVFGVNVDPAWVANGYFDLTSILLKRELGRRTQFDDGFSVLEIGIGRFAVLSGWLSRRIDRRIVACDVDPIAVESARLHIERNRLNVECLHSDVLASVPVAPYDLVIWNLPYYDAPDRILTALFESVPDYMVERSRLILGFNTKALKDETVNAILSRFPALELETTRRYWWNLHALSVIRLAGSAPVACPSSLPNHQDAA